MYSGDHDAQIMNSVPGLSNPTPYIDFFLISARIQ